LLKTPPSSTVLSVLVMSLEILLALAMEQLLVQPLLYLREVCLAILLVLLLTD
jgi:hypothetical protein